MNEYPTSSDNIHAGVSPQPVEDTLQGTPPSPAVRVSVPQSAPYVTYSIIGITVFIYLLQLVTQALVQYDIPALFFIKSNELIRAGQIWRLITPALLHGTSFILHIGFNMYALYRIWDWA